MPTRKDTRNRALAAEQQRKGPASINLRLKRETCHRHRAEANLKKSQAHYAKLFRESLVLQGQMKNLSRRLLLTQEEERKRISRELHDEIVQTLVGIKVHLASLSLKSRIDGTDLRLKIKRTQRLVEQSVEVVHRFARELRPTMLDDLGLIPALKSFIKDFAERTRIHIKFTAGPEVELLNDTQRTILYRVAQSALVNVDKHAEATLVRVSLHQLKKVIRLQIHDNGKSFDFQRVLLAKRHKRLGLLGSRERVEMVGGKFSIASTLGKGTRVTADLPFLVCKENNRI